MSVTKFVVTAASVGCLALASTGVVSAATTAAATDVRTDVRTQTYGPVITPGFVSNVYGFPARDICRLLDPSDKSEHRQVMAAGLSLTYNTTSSAATVTEDQNGTVSTISAVQTLTGAKAVMAQCR